MSLRHQPKAALINDFSGFGRCSVRVWALFNCCGAAGHFGNEGSVLSGADLRFF